MEELKDILKRRVIINNEIEKDMYVDSGPSNEQYMESFELENSMKAKEQEIILNHYRDLVGSLQAEITNIITQDQALEEIE
tara:strand:+ start:519 stop:761 length:243 start_codon:yes stop_codon:yes gene_type:complete